MTSSSSSAQGSANALTSSQLEMYRHILANPGTDPKFLPLIRERIQKLEADLLNPPAPKKKRRRRRGPKKGPLAAIIRDITKTQKEIADPLVKAQREKTELEEDRDSAQAVVDQKTVALQPLAKLIDGEKNEAGDVIKPGLKSQLAKAQQRILEATREVIITPTDLFEAAKANEEEHYMIARAYLKAAIFLLKAQKATEDPTFDADLLKVVGAYPLPKNPRSKKGKAKEPESTPVTTTEATEETGQATAEGSAENDDVITEATTGKAKEPEATPVPITEATEETGQATATKGPVGSQKRTKGRKASDISQEDREEKPSPLRRSRRRRNK